MKFVKGGEKTVQITESSTVFELKSAVALAYSIPEVQQKLLYKGRILEDSKSLNDYSIKNLDTVVLMSTYTAPEIPIVEAPPQLLENEADDEEVDRGTFNFLLGNADFEKIAQIIKNNPREFENFILQLETSNPELLDLINSHKKEFTEFISGRNADESQLQLSKEEFRDVKDLMGLGFSAQDSLDAYLSCGKNKEIAANLLFSGGN